MAATTRDIAGFRGAELIGQGGFSAVYRADDAVHGRQVAIKVLDGALGEAERRRFDRERQTMGRLGSHPNIVAVYDSGYSESGEGYIVMELATGGSVGGRLRSAGPLPWTEAVGIMAAIATATQAAHDNGVLHRDIKPDNILIDMFGNPKLTDFGIAAVATSATATVSTTATLAHAAPEVLEGRPATAAVDVYALGSTLFALITGWPPFARPGDEGVTPMITRALTEPPPNLRLSGIPDAVARVVERALAKDPAARHPSAAHVAAELRAAAAAGAAGPGAAPGPGGTAGPAPPSPPVAPVYPEPGPFDPPASAATTALAAAAATQAGQGWAPPPSGPPSVGPPPAGGPVQSPSSAPGAGARIALVAAGVLAVVMAVVVGALALTRSGGDGSSAGTSTAPTTAESTTPTTPTTIGGTATSPAPGAATGAGVATVTIDCPAEVPVGVETFCTISTTDAVEGRWELPGFLDADAPIETLNGAYDVFIEPTSGEAVGSTFTMTATVMGTDGKEVAAEHRFVVTGPTVEIRCPDTITLGTTAVCDIVTGAGVVEGEWSIPGFGGDPLDVVPGANPISIQPSAADAVGLSFTITVTVRDANGIEVSATRGFTVVAG